ncbi:MAG: hypothetical protein AAF567_02520 [Actinomycetota bacterium]
MTERSDRGEDSIDEGLVAMGAESVPGIDRGFADRLEAELRVRHAQTRRRSPLRLPRRVAIGGIAALVLVAVFVAAQVRPSSDQRVELEVFEQPEIAEPADGATDGDPGADASGDSVEADPTADVDGRVSDEDADGADAAREPVDGADDPDGAGGDVALDAGDDRASVLEPTPSAVAARPSPTVSAPEVEVDSGDSGSDGDGDGSTGDGDGSTIAEPEVTPATTPTEVPRATPTAAVPTPTAAPRPTPTAIAAATPQPRPSPTATPTPTVVPTATPTPSPTPTPLPIVASCSVLTNGDAVGVECTWQPPPGAEPERWLVQRVRNGAPRETIATLRPAILRLLDRNVDSGDTVIYAIVGVVGDAVQSVSEPLPVSVP